MIRRAAALAVVSLALVWASSSVAGASLGSEDGGIDAGLGRMPVGCVSDPGSVVSTGPGAGREVALTFDDGPSSVQTPAIVATLERLGARATFFEEGRHVAGHEELMRQMLLDGDEIGNHSFDHPHYPGLEELASTNRLIRGATGFEPCLFRPPYGLVDGVDAAAALDTRLQTILWTFDAGDDHHVPAARMQAHVIGSARPGSIVLFHDGGHHPQTPLALPRIIEGLTERGFHLVTVTELLGGHFIYR
jgi:peptidoglycan-N-acetylglucosamine deacetylase